MARKPCPVCHHATARQSAKPPTIRRGLARGLAAAASATVLTVSAGASAQHPAGIDVVTQLPPFKGKADVDNFKHRSPLGTVQGGGGGEDLQNNIGIAAHYLFELTRGLGLGPRFMLLSAESKDSKRDYTTFDGSLFLRYTFNTRKVLPFVQGGLGLTYAQRDNGEDLDGIGWHVSGGGGCGFPLSDHVALYAGLLFHRQAVNVEGETHPGDNGVEADLLLTRVLATVGLGF